MRKIRIEHEQYYVRCQPRKPYGCLGFLFDCLMTIITGGLWLIWVFVREMRKR